MSNPESFIEEVTEEVRRDKLFALMRKYGWIGIALVVLIVGSAAFYEWQKAQKRAAAEALGDAVLAAMTAEDPAARLAALDAVEIDGEATVLRDLLAAGEDPQGAAARLRAVMANPDAAQIYRDLAALKLVISQGSALDAGERMALLGPLAAAGAPFRTLAEEQMALIEVESGDTAAAISRLQALLEDEEASQDLRRRASQLIVALGGMPGDG